MALEVGGTGAQQGPAAPAAEPAAARRATMLPQPSGSGTPAPATASGRMTRRRRRTVVRSVDLWSVLKISLCFYLCLLAVTMVAAVALWGIASAVGVVGNVEQFMGDLLSADDFRFLSASILEGGVLIGLALVVLLVIFTLLAAAFYNLFAQLVGGVEIVVQDEV